MTGATFIIVLAAVSLALCIIMQGAWLIWRATRNAGWIDTVWTFGLGGVGCAGAIAAAISGQGFTPRAAIVAALIAVWTGRLGSHIATRTSGINDDPRYARLVEGFGANASRGMFWIAQKQAWVSIPLAMSMLLAAWNPAPHLRVQDLLGIAALAIGIGGEALADAQLKRFKSRPENKGSICDAGLWSWSRHPNYFFEWFGWLAYPLIAIDPGGHYPWGWLALIGPLCMYWVLVHITGVPPLEEHMLKTRGRTFRAYQARTNAFFPAPPRQAKAAP
jgi:steroid 5-alpha reductase family enzyme